MLLASSSSSPRASSLWMSAIGKVPLPPWTVTTSCSAGNPRRTARDGQGERSSHSPKHSPNRAGCPNTVRDVSPARWPPMLRRHSETARPTVIEPRPPAPPMHPAR